ncbi:hypothetical protein ADK55_16355 [Streptomyces sp. WM4235]|nr:hypothetical protein ADK55_16355 [Streptomyces sp. WM4235]
MYLPPVALYSLRRSVALPAWLTHSWKAVEASPSQPDTLCDFRISPIALMSPAALTNAVPRASTVSGLKFATIAISCSIE